MFTHLFQSGVVLPDALVLLITAAIMFVVTEGLKNVLTWFGIDLSGMAAGITAAVVGIVVAFLNGLLGQIPVAFAPLAIELLNLVVFLLGGFGFYRVTKNARTPLMAQTAKK